MLVTYPLQWNAVAWPDPTNSSVTAGFYAVFVGNANTPAQVVTTTTTTVLFDDTTAGQVYFVRPCDALSPTTFGPAQVVVIAQQPLNHRAWVRSYVRKTMSDRLDNGSESQVKIEDDALNEYLNDAIRQYSLQFPKPAVSTITLLPATRDYPLATPCPGIMRIDRIKYISNDMNIAFFLRKEPYKEGESSSQNWLGFPKLGLLNFAPMTGRLYPGHYEYRTEDQMLRLDFPALGNGDVLELEYQAIRNYPVSDLDPLDVPPQDVEALTLYIQGKAWLEIESRDVNLSRWRTKEDGGSRKDLPTEVMSTRMFNAWKQYLETRRSLRPRQLRLVRQA